MDGMWGGREEVREPEMKLMVVGPTERSGVELVSIIIYVGVHPAKQSKKLAGEETVLS